MMKHDFVGKDTIEEVVDDTNNKKDWTFKDKEKVESLKRKWNVVKDIAVESATKQMADVKTFQYAAGVGLWQGLKYRGSVTQGLKAGVATIVVLNGVNIVSNLIRNADAIKKA